MPILIGTVEDLEAAGLEFCGCDKKRGLMKKRHWWQIYAKNIFILGVHKFVHLI